MFLLRLNIPCDTFSARRLTVRRTSIPTQMVPSRSAISATRTRSAVFRLHHYHQPHQLHLNKTEIANLSHRRPHAPTGKKVRYPVHFIKTQTKQNTHLLRKPETETINFGPLYSDCIQQYVVSSCSPAPPRHLPWSSGSVHRCACTCSSLYRGTYLPPPLGALAREPTPHVYRPPSPSPRTFLPP